MPKDYVPKEMEFKDADMGKGSAGKLPEPKGYEAVHKVGGGDSRVSGAAGEVGKVNLSGQWQSGNSFLGGKVEAKGSSEKSGWPFQKKGKDK